MATESEAKCNHATAAAAMRGDATAMQALWNEHRRWIAAVLLAHKSYADDLDDLLQEVAMTLVAKINTLRDESNVRAWLRAIAINTARAASRSARSRPAVHTAGTGAAGIDRVATWHPAADEHFELDDHAREVLHRLMQLPDTYREPLMLKAVHGMRTRQIAEILDLPEATVDTRISRARRMLREQTSVSDIQSRGLSSQQHSFNGTACEDRPWLNHTNNS